MKVNDYREEKAKQKSASCPLRHGSRSVVQWRADDNIFILSYFTTSSFIEQIEIRCLLLFLLLLLLLRLMLLFVERLMYLEPKFFSLIIFYNGYFFILKY
jgi:hypothetical protein